MRKSDPRQEAELHRHENDQHPDEEAGRPPGSPLASRAVLFDGIFGSYSRDQALALPAYRQEMCERLMNRRCQHDFALRIRAMARAGQFVDHPAEGASANESEPLCESGTSPGSGPTPLYGPSDARTRVRLFHFAHIEQNAPRSPSPPSRLRGACNPTLLPSKVSTRGAGCPLRPFPERTAW